MVVWILFRWAPIISIITQQYSQEEFCSAFMWICNEFLPTNDFLTLTEARIFPAVAFTQKFNYCFDISFMATNYFIHYSAILIHRKRFVPDICGILTNVYPEINL